jgi:hypothetical protein
MDDGRRRTILRAVGGGSQGTLCICTIWATLPDARVARTHLVFRAGRLDD